MPSSLSSAFAAAGLAMCSPAWAVVLPGVLAGWVPWRYFGLHQW